MSEFINHIHCRPGFEIGKLDSLSRSSGEEKSGIGGHFFDGTELLDLENDGIREKEDAEDMELEGIDVATWKKKNRLWIVLQENRLEVLCQQDDSQIAGHGR